MERTTFLLLGVLAALQGPLAAQAPVELGDLVERRGVYLHAETLAAFSGPVVELWDGATVRVRGILKEGRWDGLRESYYMDGKLEARETYRAGVLHGPFESFFRSGAPSDRGTYVDGRLEGEYQAFWSRAQADIHAAHRAGGHGDAGSAGDVMEHGAWSRGEPCGDWYRFLPRNSQGLRTGETVHYSPCPETGR